MIFFDEESHRVVDLPADQAETDPPAQATSAEIRNHLTRSFVNRRESRFEEHLAEVPLVSDKRQWSGEAPREQRHG